MRAWMLTAAALGLAGCAGGEVAGFGPAVVGGGVGLPSTRAEARPDAMTPPGRRDLGVSVRTFAPGPDGALAQVAGATCRVTAGSFAATFVTPGRLVLPDLGPDAPPVAADCTAGALAGSAAVAPDFRWIPGGGNPPERVLWGLGWTYGFEKVGPVRYPPLAVTLRETAPGGL
jgi:hypothetical protein